MKINLDRPHGATDLVPTAAADATVGDVAAALADRDPARRGPGTFGVSDGGLPGQPGPVTLTMLDGQRVTLDPGLPLADSGITSGDRVTVVQGPDAGRRVQLAAGNQTIGRGAGCDLRLSDTLASRRHVRVFLAPGSAEILDLGSANGVTLNDEPVARGAWLTGDRLRVGDTVLGIEFAAGDVRPAASAAHAGMTPFNRSPVITGSYAGESLEAPELPEAEHGPRFPVLPMLAPFLIDGVLFAITKNAESLIFIALSPMMMLANLVEGRMSAARGSKGSMAALRR